jgi:prevent-host-death family protein
MAWQLQAAKQQLDQLVQSAIDDGPQVISLDDEKVAVIMSIDEYRRLLGEQPDFKEFILNGPDMSMLDLSRDRSLPRDVEL